MSFEVSEDNNPIKISLALSGGFADGAYEFGILKYLSENRHIVEVTDIISTSIGCLNSLAFLSDKMQEGEKLWLEADFKGFVNLYRYYVKDYVVKEYIDILLDYEQFINTDTRMKILLSTLPYFRAAVCNMNQLSYDELNHLLLASINMPILMPKKKYLGKRIIDGGFTANTPVNHLTYLPKNQPIVLVHFEPEPIFRNKQNNIHELYYSKSRRTLRGLADFSYETIKQSIEIGYSDMEKLIQENRYNLSRKTQFKYVNPHYLLRKFGTFVRSGNIELN